MSTAGRYLLLDTVDTTPSARAMTLDTSAESDSAWPLAASPFIRILEPKSVTETMLCGEEIR